MKGLLKNNFYAALSNGRILAGILLLLGSFVVVIGRKMPSALMFYILLAIIGFSLNFLASIRKEWGTKWGKYKLTLPVRRSEIVRSYFWSLLLWLAAGMLFAGIGTALSIALHGFFLDRATDVYLLFVVGAGISLMTAAIFFPLLYWGGEARNEVSLGISILCGVGLTLGLIALENALFSAPLTAAQIVLGGELILGCAGLAFALAYFISVSIFRRKEY